MLCYLPMERSVFLGESCSSHLPFAVMFDLLEFAFQDSCFGVWGLSGALGLSPGLGDWLAPPLPYSSPSSCSPLDPLAPNIKATLCLQPFPLCSLCSLLLPNCPPIFWISVEMAVFREAFSHFRHMVMQPVLVLHGIYSRCN